MAYAAAGVAPGDEVVTSPMTFVATAAAVAARRRRSVFADVEDDTGTSTRRRRGRGHRRGPRVVAAVDYAGHPADYDELRAVADGAGALLIADAAHSIGGDLPRTGRSGRSPT